MRPLTKTIYVKIALVTVSNVAIHPLISILHLNAPPPHHFPLTLKKMPAHHHRRFHQELFRQLQPRPELAYHILRERIVISWQRPDFAALRAAQNYHRTYQRRFVCFTLTYYSMHNLTVLISGRGRVMVPTWIIVDGYQEFIMLIALCERHWRLSGSIQILNLINMSDVERVRVERWFTEGTFERRGLVNVHVLSFGVL